jgi:hypothetical protein
LDSRWITAVDVVNAAVVGYFGAPLHGKTGCLVDSGCAIRCDALITPSHSSALIVEGQGQLTGLSTLLSAIYKRLLASVLLREAL